MASGFLRIQSFAAQRTAPIPYVTVVVVGSNFSKTVVTDAEGIAEDIEIPAPECSYSMEEDPGVQPYATCSIYAVKEGYAPLSISGNQIFDGQVTLAWLELIPAEEGVNTIEEDGIIIPPHPLFAGGGGSGPAPIDDGLDPRVLTEVVIPKNITVHLGKPAASARNVTVSFRDYIANVASSEVYPTWPEQALRANIHAQISLALNRIYTEWYKSKGYAFEITNSTSYDQYFVYGRTVFDVMVRLTDDIFNTYVRKTGTVNPYYTEYCDGKSVSCPGMKQWGTVTLANNGYNALRILQYYYGSNTEIVRTSNIRSIPESYPGSPLREGDRGTAVYTLQRQLNRITKDYPFFGTLTVDGIFGPAMTATVKRFQKQFNLPQDGVVGRQTWYKISYIYVSVKDLAELTSEGETANGQLSGGSWGGVTLRRGSSGAAVQQLQYWLNVLAQYDSAIPSLTVDGQFGAGTEAAVRAFQRKYGLTVDGVVGRTTWDAIYARYQSAQSDTGTGGGNAYPGSALAVGSRGNNVKLVQFWLRMARTNYSSLPNVTVDGEFGNATRSAVMAFQRYFGLTADGVVGRSTWNKLREVYTGVANKLLSPSLRPGQFPGTLRRGSTGTAVRELQYYLYTVAAYQSSVPTVTIDGSFGSSTETAVRAFQRLQGLTVDGVVGQTTWNALYSLANGLRSSGPVVTAARMPYPGEAIGKGDSGPAVLYYSTLLERIAFYYPEVQSPGRTEVYTEAMRQATYSLQRLLALPESGVVEEATWQAAEALSLALLADRVDADSAARRVYPGYAAAEGSAGGNVQQVQQWQNDIAARYAPEAFVPEDGFYSAEDEAWIRKFQQDTGLQPTGVVDEQTWYELQRIAEGGPFDGAHTGL